MSKSDSMIIKGVGIIMMVFHHLFVLPNDIDFYYSFLRFEDVPMVHKLAFEMSPVYLFLIISGYGYYEKFSKGGRARITHFISLFIKYWMILTFFIVMGMYIGKFDDTILDFRTLIYNYTGYNCTINREIWFLLPFVCLCICTNWVLIFFEKHTSYTLIIAFILWLSSGYVLTHYNQPLIIMLLLRIGSFIFPFLIGAWMSKFKVFEKLSKSLNHAIVSLLLVALLYIHMVSNIPQLLFCVLLIILFNLSFRPQWLNVILAHLGKYSASIWFTHTFICYYLFHDFVYSLRYPLLILVFLVGISLLFAHVFDYIHQNCWNGIYNLSNKFFVRSRQQ